MEDINQDLERMLFQVTGLDHELNDIGIQAGGCINMAVSCETNHGKYFIKWNELSYKDMFEKEADGLALLKTHCPLAIPDVIGQGIIDEKAFLVLDFLENSPENPRYWKQLGEGLAALHLHKADQHGLGHDNYIGRLVQQNTQRESWPEFFRDHRLNQQLGLAIYNDFVDQAFVRDFKLFLNKLPDLLPESDASLLHGDLWSGNAMALWPQGASIFDPAVYFGAREMDLAMTRLFGGFDRLFYEAYHSVYPIPTHFESLLEIYNLYPLMVHVNLFGPNAGYSRSVSQIIKRYL